MDDYNAVSLTESKNEWMVRLVNLITPCIITGLQELFKESWELCLENDEEEKYLMTFQNFLSRIPKWNNAIIDKEVERILETSTCNYLEDLITCVHVVQLKALSCMRVGKQQKKVDIDSPSLKDFIHKVYIHVARKLYTNIYLFEKDILPLEVQKNNRELELIVRECIFNSIRENIPIEGLLRAYLDETEETDTVEVIKEEKIEVPQEVKSEIIKEEGNVENKAENVDNKGENVVKNMESTIDNSNKDTNITLDVKTPVVKESQPALPAAIAAPKKIEMTPAIAIAAPKVPVMGAPIAAPKVSAAATSAPAGAMPEKTSTLQFSDNDKMMDSLGNESVVNAPKTINRLEKISDEAYERRKNELEEDDDDDDYIDNITIGDNISLDVSDVNDLTKSVSVEPPPSLDIEVLS